MSTQFFTSLIHDWSWLISILALFGIEFSPIKVHPISFICRCLKKGLGIDDLSKKLNQLEIEVDQVRSDLTTHELDRIRCEILQFAQDLREGHTKTELDYRHIEEIYEKYHDRGGNSYITSEMEFIRKCRNKID